MSMDCGINLSGQKQVRMVGLQSLYESLGVVKVHLKQTE